MISQTQCAEPGSAALPADDKTYTERMMALPPKGTCWYCDQIVDNVRRFCSVACRNDYFEEERQFPASEV
jgi:hypothetical protein